MLNILRTLTLIFIATFILAACGEGETPATTAADESKAAVTEETPAVVAEEPETAGGTVQQVDEPVAETPPETATPAETPVATPVTTSESAAPEAKTAEATTSNAPIDGGQLYNTYCAICHRAGMNAAPKYGNKALWAKRIAQGRETMYNHAINGLRGMPARGGFAQLTDDEVKAAVDYMVRAAGGWKD